jgi:hypothetical protein
LQEKKIGDPILAFFPLYLPKDEYVFFFSAWRKQKLSRIFMRRRELAQFIRETRPENRTTLVYRPHN